MNAVQYTAVAFSGSSSYAWVRWYADVKVKTGDGLMCVVFISRLAGKLAVPVMVSGDRHSIPGTMQENFWFASF